jgi:hypothetical protein
MIFQEIFDFPMGEMSHLPVSKYANFVTKSAKFYVDTCFYFSIWRLFIIFAPRRTTFITIFNQNQKL